MNLNQYDEVYSNLSIKMSVNLIIIDLTKICNYFYQKSFNTKIKKENKQKSI